MQNHFQKSARRPAWRVAVAATTALAAAISQQLVAQESGVNPVEEIMITGSRIVRRDLEAASPLVTVESQVFEESSTLAVESVLNQLPQFVPANTQFNTSDVFPSATSTPGISTVSLRGLGSNRTLVLVDGRRAQPVNSTLVIDTNSIPSSALEGVEIISGGASAVYGADALGGVTNFKLRRNFQGIDLQFRTGITEEGDGEENRLSLLLGSSFDDGRGNAMLGVEWTERGEVMALDRKFYRNALKDPLTNSGSNGRMNGYQYEPSTTGMSSATRTAFQNAANSLFPERPTGYNVPITTQFLFNDDTSLYKVERQGLGFNGDIANDINYKIAPNGQLIQTNLDMRYSSPLERYSLFGKSNYAINDWLEVFSQVNFVNTTNRQVLQPSGAVGGFSATVPYGNAIYGPSRAADGSTLPAYQAGGAYGLNCPATGGCTNSQAFPVSPELAALLNARGANVYPTTNRTFDPVTGVEIPTQGVDAPWRLGSTMDFLPPRTIENTTNLFQILVGLRGDLGLGDWTWEAYLSHGATRTDLDYIGWVSTQRFLRLAREPNYGRGADISGLASANLQCTSGLPVFGTFAISQDCVNALTGFYTDRTRLSQDIVEANAQGKLFDLPAGEVRSAVGVTKRKNEFQYSPDATRERNNIIDAVVGSFGQANVRGETEVWEVYGELLVPVLRDQFMIRSLDLELGARYSDYDTAGSVPTYKALFSWEPIDWMRFRGGYQLANRAPNINELFLDASSTAVTTRGAEPCRSDTRELTGNHPTNPNRAAVQALCEALIGNTTSTFSADPNGYTGGRADGVMLHITSGNRALQSEEGTTWTFGTVLRSPFDVAWLEQTTMAIDWYRAKITDAITQVGAQTTYDLCFNRDGASNPTYSIDDPNGVCRNIVRDANDGAALTVNSTFANTGTIVTSGLDINLNWRAELADIGLGELPGSLSLSVSFTKLFEFKAQEFVGGTVLENAGTLARGGLFDWRTVTTLRYFIGNVDVALNWRHLPSVLSANYVTDPTTTVQGAKAYDVFNLTGNWNITEAWSVSGGIDNLFDRQPNRVGAGQVFNISAANGGGQTITNGSGSTSSGYYDVLGRRYFINIKVRY
ncbi:MAG: TonB-dependent receptor [Gammaproteobacteria bacterium]|nr:TonB-dependent receptor [Gammaproteobacteria bacterium]